MGNVTSNYKVKKKYIKYIFQFSSIYFFCYWWMNVAYHLEIEGIHLFGIWRRNDKDDDEDEELHKGLYEGVFSLLLYISTNCTIFFVLLQENYMSKKCRCCFLFLLFGMIVYYYYCDFSRGIVVLKFLEFL